MATPLAYIIDATRLDISIKSTSSANQCEPMKIRPWLIVCFEPISKRTMGSCFSEEPPNLKSIKAVLHKSFLASSDDGRSAAIPDELWFDGGIDQPLLDMQHFMQSLHLTLRSTPLSGRGQIERFFRTCMTALCEISEDALEHLTAKGTLSDLEERFTQFLLHYHHQVQPSTGLTPLECWQEQCHPSLIDPHLLAPLLPEGGERHVMRDGIHYQGRTYWHADLASYLGKKVFIRVKPFQLHPETIEIFFEQQWICTAFLQAKKEDGLHGTE
jgi:putative transposase